MIDEHRRESLLVLGAVIVAGMTVVAVIGFARREREITAEAEARAERCPDAYDLLTEDAGTGKRAYDAFGRVGVAYAGTTLNWINRTLGERAVEWANRVGGKCHDPDWKVRACIEEQRAFNHALYVRLAKIDRDGVERLVSLFEELPASDDCAPSVSRDLATARADLVVGATPDGLAAAARAAREAADPPGALMASLIHARIALALGHTDDALAELALVLPRAVQAKATSIEIDARLALAAVELSRGHIEQLHAALDELTPLHPYMDSRRKARMRMLGADLARLREDHATAIAELEEAARLARAKETQPWALPILDALARAYLRADDIQRARKTAADLVEETHKLGDWHPVFGRALLLAGYVDVAAKDLVAARRDAARAQDIASRNGGELHADMADVHDLFASIAIAAGDTELAKTHQAIARDTRSYLTTLK